MGKKKKKSFFPFVRAKKSTGSGQFRCSRRKRYGDEEKKRKGTTNAPASSHNLFRARGKKKSALFSTYFLLRRKKRKKKNEGAERSKNSPSVQKKKKKLPAAMAYLQEKKKILLLSLLCTEKKRKKKRRVNWRPGKPWKKKGDRRPVGGRPPATHNRRSSLPREKGVSKKKTNDTYNVPDPLAWAEKGKGLGSRAQLARPASH